MRERGKEGFDPTDCDDCEYVKGCRLRSRLEYQNKRCWLKRSKSSSLRGDDID